MLGSSVTLPPVVPAPVPISSTLFISFVVSSAAAVGFSSGPNALNPWYAAPPTNNGDLARPVPTFLIVPPILPEPLATAQMAFASG